MMSTDSTTAQTLKTRTLVLCFDGTSNQYDGEVCVLLMLPLPWKANDLVEHQCRQVLLAFEEKYNGGATLLLSGSTTLRL